MEKTIGSRVVWKPAVTGSIWEKKYFGIKISKNRILYYHIDYDCYILYTKDSADARWENWVKI